MTDLATDQEREAYLDLKQRYRFLYGMGLQARLATQGEDLVAWWGIGTPESPRPPATILEPPEPRWADLPERVRDIIRGVSQERGVPIDKIIGYQRLGKYADARQECYRRLRTMPWRGGQPSLLQIGIWMQRDHTTVLHGVNKR